ncbi:MAG TPA: hypothetical protein VK363_07680 [Pyrinomonadaceae bacterium]|nr:hypothetical protein [Pyrinomonadaceae bacterium]
MNVHTNLTGGTILQAAPEPFNAPLERAGEVRAAGDDSSLIELHIWQLALRSFFNLRNHSLSDAERAEIISRDFSPELRIAGQVLRRCLLFSLNCTPEPSHASFETNESGAFDALPSGAPRDSSFQVDNTALVPLINTFGELCCMCENMLLSAKVDYQAWTSVARIVRRELERSPFIKQLERRVRAGTLLRQRPELQRLTERISPDTLAADMSVIFSQLTHLLEQLRLVEALLKQDAPLKQTLPIFTSVHEESRSLVEFIEKRAIRTKEIDGAVFDALDCTGYAVGVELARVFGRELVGLASLRQSPAIYTKIENAHGLLRDSFQQTLVALAQVFDPAFAGADFFQSFRSRLEQSLVLRRDLWMLLQLVLQAEKDRDRRPLAPLLERLDAFREGSLRFLMYKDWEPFERFVAEVLAARGAVEVTPVLHRFGTYLEALFGQINMRIVLADHPFNYPAIAD